MNKICKDLGRCICDFIFSLAFIVSAPVKATHARKVCVNLHNGQNATENWKPQSNIDSRFHLPTNLYFQAKRKRFRFKIECISIQIPLISLQREQLGERNGKTGADPGGARGPGPPLTLGFEELSIFGPYLIFHNFFLPHFARHNFFNMLLIHVKLKYFPASLHLHMISHLILVSHILGY